MVKIRDGLGQGDEGDVRGHFRRRLKGRSSQKKLLKKDDLF